MKYIKKYENRNFKYQVGDYIIPIETENGKNPKDSYSVIDNIIGGNLGDYMISTYNIYTNKKVEGPWPIFDNEIVRKLTPGEIENIEMLGTTKKFNI